MWRTTGVALLLILLCAAGCSYHSTAKDWNGLLGNDGMPTYYKTTTKVALHLFVFIPLIGDTTVPQMVDELTEEVAEAKGDWVRIVHGETRNYWHGFPPITLIFTPVIITVSAEYTPDRMTYYQDQQEYREEKEMQTGQ